MWERQGHTVGSPDAAGERPGAQPRISQCELGARTPLPALGDLGWMLTFPHLRGWKGVCTPHLTCSFLLCWSHSVPGSALLNGRLHFLCFTHIFLPGPWAQPEPQLEIQHRCIPPHTPRLPAATPTPSLAPEDPAQTRGLLSLAKTIKCSEDDEQDGDPRTTAFLLWNSEVTEMWACATSVTWLHMCISWLSTSKGVPRGLWGTILSQVNAFSFPSCWEEIKCPSLSISRGRMTRCLKQILLKSLWQHWLGAGGCRRHYT